MPLKNSLPIVISNIEAAGIVIIDNDIFSLD